MQSHFLRFFCIFAHRNHIFTSFIMSKTTQTTQAKSQHTYDDVQPLSTADDQRQNASWQLISEQVDFLMEHEEHLNRIIDQRIRFILARANIK